MLIEQTGLGAGAASGAARAVTATCPACGYHVAAPFYDGGRQPLATLGWPATAREARAMRRLPLEFVRCLDCGHVFNAAFDYAAVPYSRKPNLMFNRGTLWSRFLDSIRREMLRRLPARPAVVEIGYGDASFLAALARARPGGRYTGFDPHGARAPEGGGRIELRRELFDASRHLEPLRPDLILSRHVMEHLANPLGFIQTVAFSAAQLDLQPLIYLEVPCIDRAIETFRAEDFYYEHNSHFTSTSFRRMLARSGADIEALGHGYDGEVVYAFLRLRERLERLCRWHESTLFHRRAGQARQAISEQLRELLAAGKRVAVWGGTGKSAAFLHAHAGLASGIACVVDSDPAKAGTFVPGLGIEIRFRDWLRRHPADVILIPAQWRARDIAGEMKRAGIRYESVLIPHAGQLVDFFRGAHPYRKRSSSGRRAAAGSGLAALAQALQARPTPAPEAARP